MGAQSDVDRYRKAIQALQSKIAAESKKVAAARERAGRARQQASRVSSPTQAKSKIREAERRETEAVASEKRRSDLERQLSEKQRVLHQAEAKLDKERASAQSRSLKRLEDRASRAERQFHIVTEPAGPTVTVRARAVNGDEHDVFISYASEDKDEVARPLADLLVAHDLKVWYDDFSLTVGDSLRRSIDRGLAGARFGVVVLSPDFFRKEWPQAELDGLVAKQRATGSKVLLPIWHRVTRDDVVAESPMLSDLKALNTSVMTLADIANEIASAVGPLSVSTVRASDQSGESDASATVLADIQRMVFDGSLRSQIDEVVDDPELSVG